mgnify:FL=1
MTAHCFYFEKEKKTANSFFLRSPVAKLRSDRKFFFKHRNNMAADSECYSRRNHLAQPTITTT